MKADFVPKTMTVILNATKIQLSKNDSIPLWYL